MRALPLVLVLLVAGCPSGPAVRCMDATRIVCDGLCTDVSSDDANCGSCGVRCGTARCIGGSCVSRTTDAGRPPTDGGVVRPDAPIPTGAGECEPCSDTSDCAAGLFCGGRRCDGITLCYTSSGSCGGDPATGVPACPATSDFELCSSELGPPGCGTLSDCVRVNDFQTACRHRCTTAADCTSVPVGFDGRVQECVSGHCRMRCDGGAECPPSSSCGGIEPDLCW